MLIKKKYINSIDNIFLHDTAFTIFCFVKYLKTNILIGKETYNLIVK